MVAIRSLFSLLLMLGMCIGGTMAQDIIVTLEGEQIRCRIIDMDSLQVVYMLHGPKEQGQLMPRYRIHSIERDVPGEMQWVRKNRRKWESSRVQKMKGFRVGLGAGYSYLLAPSGTSNALLWEYAEKLRSGFNIKANATYFFGRFFGLGVSYGLFHSENKMENIYYQNYFSGVAGIGEMSDNINIHFVGIHPTARVPIAKGKAHFLGGVSVGYTQWVNNAVLGVPMTIKSETYGVMPSLGFDVRLYTTFYLGVTSELILANSRSVTYSDDTHSVTRKADLNMNRFDASLSLRYYLK